MGCDGVFLRRGRCCWLRGISEVVGIASNGSVVLSGIDAGFNGSIRCWCTLGLLLLGIVRKRDCGEHCRVCGGGLCDLLANYCEKLSVAFKLLAKVAERYGWHNGLGRIGTTLIEDETNRALGTRQDE